MTGTEPTVDATGGGPGAELPTGQVTDTGLAAPPPPADHRFDAEIDELLEISGIDANVDQVQAILRTTVGLGHDRPARLDLKITNAALAEMRAAFRIFAPYVDIPKVTIFGSARVTEADPLWNQTRDLAAALADCGWMVVTGAGPGIMHAGMEGAGAERSIGVSIRLPFETEANEVIAKDPKLVSMKYFFTRKLMLVKESSAFVCMPGGFGTLDETLELLTLQQTGKAEPTPIVLLDAPGGRYWPGFDRFVREELATRGMVADDDMERVLVTDSVDAARTEILQFWRNYHSLRWVGSTLVLRLRADPTDDEVADLNDRFGRLVASGRIARSRPLGPERSSGDEVHLPRLTLVLDQYRIGSLHQLIRAVNDLPSAPPLPGP
ncbi:MAG: TIGR00730 family Rossman fold protein [Acidimicrobiales bacterium]|nr:TIGR00730 family Rossman fold protein [Acidimicrobiales bacterium]